MMKKAPINATSAQASGLIFQTSLGCKYDHIATHQLCNANPFFIHKTGKLVTVNLSDLQVNTIENYTSIYPLPSAYRPSSSIVCAGTLWNTNNNQFTPCRVSINSSGQIIIKITGNADPAGTDYLSASMSYIVPDYS